LPIVLAAPLLAAVAEPHITELGDLLTRNTVRVSIAWYAVALWLMLRLRGEDWRARSRIGALARWCWSFALACFLVHVAVAFHFYHRWSHADAFERTRRISGMGEGLYLSYLFTVLWTADVLYWWVRPAGYAVRSAWIHRTLHAFMLFIVFNSMVVFETGWIRWAGVGMFAALGLAYRQARARSRDVLRSESIHR
jgi:hypothetical protein